MNSINRVIISGNLTRDPELRELASGTSVASLGVAVNERRKVDGEWTDVAHYFDVTVWAGQGEACARFLTTGSPVIVDGRLTQDRWENDEGQNRSAVKIVANEVIFLPRRENGDSGNADDSAQRGSKRSW